MITTKRSSTWQSSEQNYSIEVLFLNAPKTKIQSNVARYILNFPGYYPIFIYK